MKKPDVTIYDTTLRDGTQGTGISFSVTYKIRVAEKLDAGVLKMSGWVFKIATGEVFGYDPVSEQFLRLGGEQGARKALSDRPPDVTGGG